MNHVAFSQNSSFGGEGGGVREGTKEPFEKLTGS